MELVALARQCRLAYIAALEQVSVEEATTFADTVDLMGHCALVSQALFHLLTEQGYEPLYVVASDHVYVHLDGKSYDLSAMQFSRNFPPVHIFDHEAWPFTPVFRTQCTEELQQWLVEHGWSEEQIYPNSFTAELSCGIE